MTVMDELKEEQQKEMNRMGSHLGTIEKALEKHPLTQQELIFVQIALHFLHLQTRWSSAKPLDRFSIVTHASLMAHQTTQSETGFVGPALSALQGAVVRLMQADLPPVAVGLTDLIANLVSLATIGVLYLDTQLGSNWKGLFPKKHPVEVEQAGDLFEELSLLFLFRSQVIEGLFKEFLKEMGLNEKQQERNARLLRLYLLALILLSDEPKKRQVQFEHLQTFTTDSLESVQDALKQAQEKSILDEEMASHGLASVQLAKRSLDHQDIAALMQAIKDGMEAYGLSSQAVQEDLKQLKMMCSQFKSTFQNIFFQAGKAMTTMDQAA